MNKVEGCGSKSFSCPPLFYSGVGSYVGWLMIGAIPLCGDHSLSSLMAAVSLFIRTGTSKHSLWGLQSRRVLCPIRLEMHSEIENTAGLWSLRTGIGRACIRSSNKLRQIYTHTYIWIQTHLLVFVTLYTCYPFRLLWKSLLFLFCLECLSCLWCLYPFYYCFIWCLFSLFIRVFYVWICFVLILPSWLPAASVSSAISFTEPQIKQ